MMVPTSRCPSRSLRYSGLQLRLIDRDMAGDRPNHLAIDQRHVAATTTSPVPLQSEEMTPCICHPGPSLPASEGCGFGPSE